MSKSNYKILIGVLALLVFVMAIGCSFGGDQTEEANDFIKKANENLKKYNEIDSEAADIGDKFKTISENTEGYKEALKLTERLGEIVDEQKGYLEDAKSEYEKVDELKISDDFKEYVSMEVDYIEAMLKTNEESSNSVSLLKQLFEKIIAGNAPQEELSALNDKIEESTSKADDLTSKANDLKDKANDFYKEKNIGKD